MLLLDPPKSTFSATRQSELKLPELITYGRLPLIPTMVIGVLIHSAALTIGALVAFVLVDILDGIIARRLGAESVKRRALDSIVDRVGIHAVFLAYAITASALPVVWLALLARDSAQFVVSFRAARSGFIGVGGLPHKLIGLGTALTGGYLVLIGHVPWQLTVGMVVGLVWCTLTYVMQMLAAVSTGTATGIVEIPSHLRFRGTEGVR